MNMHGIVNQIAAHEKTAVALGQSLRDGGFVFVKIVQDKGGGNYILSLGNNKFQGSSPFKLQVGSVLRVKVEISGEQIKFIPEEFSKTAESQLVKFNSEAMAQFQLPEQVSQALSNLGLPPDAISMKLIAFLQQMGIKFDTQLLSKCRRVASKFPGRESEAAEVALFLAEKGVEIDEEKVAALLNMFLCNFPSSPQENDFNQKGESLKEEKELENFFNKLYDTNLSSLPNSYGLLTLLNHLSSKNKHWIVLPFQCVFQTENKSLPIFSSGNIRVLFDVSKKNIEKILLCFQSDTFEYNFMIYYKGSLVSKIAFNRSPDFLNKGQKELAEQCLFELFGLKVDYVQKVLIDSFFVDSEESILAVRLEV